MALSIYMVNRYLSKCFTYIDLSAQQSYGVAGAIINPILCMNELRQREAKYFAQISPQGEITKLGFECS